MKAVTRDQIQQQVVSRLAELLEEETQPEITGETDLRQDLGLNSLDAVSFVLQIEEDFDITVDDEEVAGLERVADVVAAIEAKLAAASA
jgi:acyl carrier protein